MTRFILLLLLATLLTACQKSPPEQIILGNIDAVQQAIEAKRAGAVLEFVDEQFLGNKTLDKQALQRLLLYHFLRHNNINAAISRLSVTINPVDPTRATMSATAILTGAENLLPSDGRIYNISGQWQLDGGDWLLVSMDWE